MRASHISAAVLAAAFAMGTAQAAEVELYGLIDTGLSYQHVDKDVANEDATDQLQMKSSQSIPNRWGMRGSEDLGNGLKVGFMLESQFGSDDGSMTGNRLFQRTAQISLTSSYGTVVVGRSGSLRSGFGTTGLWGGKVAPFSNSWGDYIAGSKFIMPGGFKAIDNAVTYQSPVFSGVQLHAQYSFKTNNVEEKNGVEGKSSSDRMLAVGATYTGGPVHVVFVLDSVLYGNRANTNYDFYDDSLAASLAGTYNFGFMKLYASGMYFKGMKGADFQGHTVLKDIDENASYKGYSLQVGADVPAFGGTAKINFGWMDGETDQKAVNYAGKSDDIDRFSAAVGYLYPLSKRTSVYGGLGYVMDSSNKFENSDPSAYEAVCGIVHRF